MCDQKSCDDFITDIRQLHGRIDILVNNAGIAFTNAANDPFDVQANVTLETNYWAVRRFCDKAFPLLAKNARVVNVSSSLGASSKYLQIADKVLG